MASADRPDATHLPPLAEQLRYRGDLGLSADVTFVTDLKRVGGSSGPVLPSPAPAPLVEVERTPLRDPEPVRWQYARPAAGDAVDVYFLTGGCVALANARVAESRDTVTVTLFQGSLPARPTRLCSAVGTEVRTRVPLRAPLGERRLLDGATTPPEPREVRPG